MSPDLLSAARAWLAAEPDDDIAAELGSLIEDDYSELESRFVDRLRFGTAGLRAAVGAGPMRMNRLVVRQAAAGLAEYLVRTEPDAATRGVIIGYDARRKSDVFALDTARVLAARGIRAMIFDDMVPTPLLAWSITGVDAVAGVMVTASHNPPADNGYKVYLASGAQIVSPVDEAIADAIGAIDPLTVPLADVADPLIEYLDRSMRDAYLAAVPAVRFRPDVSPVSVAYTALHGVGGSLLVDAFATAGLGRPSVVESQHQPDGSFPTVSFPNPEEPGAMDEVIALAERVGAVLALANDPDADRLGAAIPTADGWRRLGGDEIGWLLADHILANGSGDDRLVVTTLVSSSMLASIASRYGVHAVETYTGFKWIARTIAEHPELRFVFGYEQALGYLVCDRPRDKDGITAAVLLAEVAACAESEGSSLAQRLEGLAAIHGRHLIVERSVSMPPSQGVDAVDRLRAVPPTSIDARPVLSMSDHPEAGLLRFVLDGGVRIQVRPSGTEPKVKIYGEGSGVDPTAAVDEMASMLAG
jgi:phosphomannomutase